MLKAGFGRFPFGAAESLSASSSFDFQTGLLHRLAERLAGCIGQMMARIAAKKFFEYWLGVSWIFQVILINLCRC